MKKLTMILTLLLCIFFFHCGGQKTFVKPEYQNNSFSNAHLYMAIELTEANVSGEENFKDVGYSLTKAEYAELLKLALKEALKKQSTFQKVDYFIDKKVLSAFQEKSLLLNQDEHVFIKLPAKPVPSNLDGDIFLLVFENFEMQLVKKKFESSSPAKYYTASGGNSSNDLKIHNLKYFDYLVSIKSSYAIYHNNSDKIVSYGKLNKEAKFSLPNTIQDTIEEAVREFANDILAKTPFE